MNRRNLVWLSLAVYAVALVTPALIRIHSVRHTVIEANTGFGLLSMGWFGIFIGCLGWFANIPYVITVLQLLGKRPIRGRVPSIIALLLALTTIRPMVVPFMNDESGSNYALFRPAIGFYLWLGSMVILIVAAWLPERENLINTDRA